jgi:hypothetical protein
MPKKLYVLEQLIIFPNTQYPKRKKFIISGKDIEGGFHVADTNTESAYKDFWSEKLTNEQKVPAITHLLYCLSQYNGGETYNYIQPNENTP